MFNDLTKVFRNFVADDRGATAIEYAVLASMLSIAILGAVIGVAGGTGSLFHDMYSKVAAAIGGN